ncbi:MAG: hypothetical protein CBD11_03415 [Phycisphaera sp. TMED151]|nr:MAG: hypothetical protein CBD11_03415 [Phycisphaera sp. TMED151]
MFDLLQQTSRSFAVSIPMLPNPIREEVALAYLLFRVADTVEDEGSFDSNQRSQMLTEWIDSVRTCSTERIDHWSDFSSIEHSGYVALMDARGSLIERLKSVPLPHRELIHQYLAKTVAGMDQFLVKNDAWHDVSEIREYCYYVAGVVGEMLTAMFTSYDQGLLPAEAELMRLAPSVGESLQLVNMIRDYQSDNERNRLYFSDSISFDDLLGMATESMESTKEFLDILFRYEAQPGIVAFNAFNFSLAERALQNAKSLGHYKLDRSDVRVATQSIRAV